MIHNNRISHRKCKGEKFFAPTSTIGKILLIGAIGVQTIISCSSDGGGSEENPSSSSVIVMECPPVFMDGSFCDERDGQIYSYVTIGTGTTAQIWMAKNLNYDASGSVCYSNDPSNCDTYGRLYDWETAVAVCPNRWHLPSDDEWDVLVKYVDPDWVSHTNNVASTKLKANSNLWNTNTGTDNHGFAALPGGDGRSDGTFSNALNAGNWWSATQREADLVWYRSMLSDHSNVFRTSSNMSNKHSIRCVKNSDDYVSLFKENLKEDIDFLKNEISEVVISTDGSDVLTTVYWVTSNQMNSINTAIDNAEAVYSDKNATIDEIGSAQAKLAAARAMLKRGSKEE